TDAVGNSAVLDRTIVIGDDVAPVIEVASPSADGNPNPVLDVTAVDDFSGLDTPTWTVTVDGEVLVAASETSRIQAAIGLLADGVHTIQVTIADKAGNVGTKTISYVADSGPDVPQLPEGFITGIYVFGAPTTSTPGETHRFRAVMVKNGRPVTGRAEIREGNDTIASKELEANGTVDMAITINKLRTELTYNGPSGVGLLPKTMIVDCPACAGGGTKNPALPSANGTTGPARESGCADPLACTRTYPPNLVYYLGSIPMWNGVPLAESGADLDRVAPGWKLTLVQHGPGVFRRSRKLTLKLWTNEFSTVSLLPIGAKNRVTISPRRKTRAIQLEIGAATALGRKLKAAKPGVLIPIRLRVVASDRRGNRSAAKTVTFRVRV
ncbi:MAG: hypothetical protein JWN72_272, partial [Thermoleophilia bacterium]|nr:hypothetical protein [Thermoleophilia bacterium]